MRITVLLSTGAAIAAIAAGCGSDQPAALPQGGEVVQLDPADFTTEIDNRYWPMSPGTTWVYRETDADGNAQRVVVTVTSETREVMGIQTRVVHDLVTEDGEPIEDTYDWYAQDADGNLWYFGEETKEFENGEVVSTEGSWEAGVDGAQPGIVVPGAPEVGMTYRQEYYAGEAECLARAGVEEVSIAVAYLSGELPQGTIGVGWAALRELPPPAETPATLELLEVDAALSRLQAISGRGSHAARREELSRLFGSSTELEQRFLTSLLGGELRQGALEGVMIDAVARAAGIPVADVRRAAMLAGDLPTIAEAALVHGRDGLAQFRLTPLQPVKPMLAQTAENVAEALERVGLAAVEWKLDGARIQVHRAGAEVRVFTRNLADISDRVPEIADAIAALRVESIVLDGEAIALRADGRPQPFQVTMSRFGTKGVVADLSPATPLSAFYFDCLHLDGKDLIDRPARERLAVLEDRLPAALVVRRVETDDVVAAQAFLEDALARGHEGVMVKDLEALYEAGRRGAGWIKVKPAHTLDLVVLAAEWGHGRRHGKLSNLHLGARDPGSGGFVMLGKTFKGLTSLMLDWQTERLLALETHREGHVVHVRPELVVEIAFDGVQTSTRYPGGVALRFARVRGYRTDKRPEEADTIEAVRAIHEGRAAS